MNLIRKTIASLFIISQFSAPLAYGSVGSTKIEEKKVYSAAVQKILQEINENADYLGIKWVKGGIESDSNYNLSVFTVLNETSQNIMFIQGRLDYSKQIGKTLNIGLGSRQLFGVMPQLQGVLGSDKVMLGANAFFDSKSAKKGLLSSAHRRYSIGLELQTPKYDLYGNIYRGHSDFINNERVLSGYDFGVAANIPMIPNTKIDLSRYDFSTDVVEKTGSKLRAEYFINSGEIFDMESWLSFGGEYDKSDQNNSSNKLFMEVHFKNNLHKFGNNSNDKTHTVNTAKVWDKRYDEVTRINEVHVEKLSKQIIEIENPTAVEWGTPFNVADLVTGVKGGAKTTYSILDDGNTGATTDSETGIIENTKRAGAVIVNISISATNKYAPASRKITVEFTEQQAQTKTAPALTFTNPTSVEVEIQSEAPANPSDYDAITMGAITYKVTGGSASNGANVDGDGKVTATKIGKVVVTATTAGGSEYAAGDIGTYTVTVTGKTAPALTFINPTSVEVEVQSEAPANPSDYDAITMGAITYKVTGGSASNGANVDGDGKVTATKIGKVVVTATTAGGSEYAAGDIGTYTVTVTGKTAPALTFINPTSVEVEIQSEAPANPSDYDAITMGAITYKVTGGSASNGANVDGDGKVTATKIGKVVVTATTAGGSEYAAGDIGTYTVTVTGKTAPALTFINPTSVEVEIQSEAPANPSDYDAITMGAITYKVTGGSASNGANVDGDGKVTATKIGKVVVTATTAGGSEYAAGDIGTYTVTVTGKTAPALTFINPTSVEVEVQSEAPANPSDYDAITMGAITYKVTGGSASNGANVDGDGKVTATKIGKVVVTATTAGGSEYAAGDIGTYTVTVTGKTAPALTFINPTSVEVEVQSEAPANPSDYDAITMGAITYKVTGGSASNGANVDGDGKVTATKAGKVVVTATTAGGSEYAAGDIGTYTVTVTGKTAPALTFINPTSVEVEIQSEAPANPSDYDAITMGAITYKVTGGSASNGANVDGDGKVTATKIGKVVVTATTAGGSEYAAGDIGTYTVTVTGKTAPALTFPDQPSVVEGGESAPANPTDYDATTMGAITYKVTGGTASNGATVEGDGRVNATQKGTVIVTATTAGGSVYAAGEIGTYTITFTGKKAPALTFINPTSVEVEVQSEAPANPSDYDAITMGAITYKVTGGSASNGANVDGDGKVTATKAGKVVVTATTAGGSEYAAGDIGTYTVTVTGKTAPALTFINPTSVEVEIQSEAPANPSDYDAITMGAITYKVTGGSASNGANVDGDGKVTATKIGKVVVTATISGGSEYAAGDIGTYTVTVTRKKAPALTFINPKWEFFGEKSDAPASPTDYDAITMGAVTYTVTGGTASDGATIDGDGGVLTTKVGTVVVTVTTAGGSVYAAGDIGTYTVTVDKMWVDRDDVPQITNPTSVPVGGTSDAPNTGNISEKYGKLIFEIDYDDTGGYATIDPDTGEISGAEYPGTVEVVYYSDEGSDTHLPSDYIGDYTVLFTENQVSFSPPPNVTVGTKSDAPTMTGSYDEDKYKDTIQYKVTGGTASDGAIVDEDGKVTATKAGTVIVTVIVEDDYALAPIIPLGSYTVTVTD